MRRPVVVPLKYMCCYSSNVNKCRGININHIDYNRHVARRVAQRERERERESERERGL